MRKQILPHRRVQTLLNRLGKKRCKIDVKASHTQTQKRGTYKHNVPHQEESQLCSSILYSTFFYLSFFLLLVC